MGEAELGKGPEHRTEDAMWIQEGNEESLGHSEQEAALGQQPGL